MTARQRVLALRLLEKQLRNPNYAKKLGVDVSINKDSKKKQELFFTLAAK